ncbi:MAG: DUF4032 domain-containing protein, partial [Aquiluna sp.]|nr:DUF4032 domain-containing protein [Aquiluna sp.]
AVPTEYTGRLEPAELFHEVLEHRWYMSEKQGGDVELIDAVRSYVSDILANRRDEEALIGSLTTDSITLAEPVPTGLIVVADDDEEGDWRDKV